MVPGPGGPSGGRKARAERGLTRSRCTRLDGCPVASPMSHGGAMEEQSLGGGGGVLGEPAPQCPNASPLGLPPHLPGVLPSCLPGRGHPPPGPAHPRLRPSALHPTHPPGAHPPPGGHPQSLVQMPGLSLCGHQQDPVKYPHLHAPPERLCPAWGPTPISPGQPQPPSGPLWSPRVLLAPPHLEGPCCPGLCGLMVTGYSLGAGVAVEAGGVPGSFSASA